VSRRAWRSHEILGCASASLARSWPGLVRRSALILTCVGLPSLEQAGFGIPRVLSLAGIGATSLIPFIGSMQARAHCFGLVRVPEDAADLKERD
jgi:hypothetical protein